MVVCDTHGLVEGRGIRFEQATGTVVVGGEDECSICGRPAERVDGTYSFSNGEQHVALRLSGAQLFRLRQSLAWAHKELAKPDPDLHRTARVLEKTVEANAPQAKRWLDRFQSTTSMALAAWVGALAGVIAALVSLTPNQGVSADDLERILDETVRAVRSEQAPAEPVTPTQKGLLPESQVRPPTVTELPTPETR